MKFRKPLGFAVCILLLLSFAGSIPYLVGPVHATGANWLSGWAYRKSHVIDNATGAGTNYQVQIIVVNGSGTDSGNTVYENNKAKNDFSDVRFTASDGSAQIYYYDATVNSGANATFWVKDTDNLNSTDSTIYVYYGNSGATWDSTYCSESNTFLDVIGNVVVALPFDEDTGTTAYDQSGNGDNAVLTSGKYPNWTTGYFRYGLQFNGTNTQATIANSASFNFGNTTNFSIFCWIKAASSGVNQYFLCYDYGSPGDWEMWVSSANVLRFASTGTTSNVGSKNIADGNWHYVGVVANRTGVQQLYVDGSKDGSAQTMGSPENLTSSEPISIGSTNLPTFYFSGTLDQLQIFTSVLTTGQISDLYSNYGDPTIHSSNVDVRKYVSPEPVQSTWGAQEGPQAPYFSLPHPSYNNTVRSYPTMFSCEWLNRTNAIGSVLESDNASGTWEYNQTVTLSSINSTCFWANFTVTLTSTVGAVVDYYWIAKDTSNNWNTTMSYQTFTTTALIYPTYSLPSPSYNNTLIGHPTMFSCEWKKGTYPISTVLYSDNATGTWEWNQTATLSQIDSSDFWCNFTKTLTSTGETTVEYFWIANDTSGNWNMTMTNQTLTVSARALTYDLTVHVVDANTGSSISTATVVAMGPQNLSGVTNGGTAVLDNTPAGSYNVTASKAGYTPASVNVNLAGNTEITIRLASLTYTLTVHVVDADSGNSISGANVIVAGPKNLTGTTEGGIVVFSEMQASTYNVTASMTSYAVASVSLSLAGNTETTIRLTPSTGKRVHPKTQLWILAILIGLAAILGTGTAIFLIADADRIRRKGKTGRAR